MPRSRDEDEDILIGGAKRSTYNLDDVYSSGGGALSPGSEDGDDDPLLAKMRVQPAGKGQPAKRGSILRRASGGDPVVVIESMLRPSDAANEHYVGSVLKGFMRAQLLMTETEQQGQEGGDSWGDGVAGGADGAATAGNPSPPRPQSPPSRKTRLAPPPSSDHPGDATSTPTKAQSQEENAHGGAASNYSSVPTSSTAGGETDSSNMNRYDGAFVGYFSQRAAVNLARIDAIFARAAFAVFVTWLSLLGLVYNLAPEHSFRRLTEMEYNSAVLCGSVLFVSLVTKCTPLFLNMWSSPGTRRLSGVMIAAITVQMVAMSSAFLMAFFPVPILVDQVTGMGVYMTRWCEWTPLAFMMTFLTEGVDSKNYDDDVVGGNGKAASPTKVVGGARMKIPFLLSAAQALSTGCGLIFPLCPNFLTWAVVMFFSVALFSLIYPRLHVKRQRFLAAPRVTGRGAAVSQVEEYDRARLSYQLMATCTCIWSTFVALYFVPWIAAVFAPPESFFANNAEALNFVLEACVDVLSKVVYLHLIVDVHDSVFDEGARAARRLDELRRMMSVVWECSSDVIAISVKGVDGTVTTMLSPTILRLGGIDEVDIPDDLTGVVLEQAASDFETSSTAVSVVSNGFGNKAGSESGGGNGNDKSSPRLAEGHDTIEYCSVDVTEGRQISIADEKVRTATLRGLASLRSLMVSAWTTERSKNVLMHDLTLGPEDDPLRCEATLTRLEPNAIVAVIRDISERFKRFEAEKQAILESTARKKDEQANRFTRHEVKNGLLAAMALCDSLKDSSFSPSGPPSNAPSASGSRRSSMASLLGLEERDASSDVHSTLGSVCDDLYRLGVSGSIRELESTLKEVLDTVLAEAMARDVVHEVYEPKLERVDLQSLLSCCRGYGESTESRFPIVSIPAKLPMFVFDPQLLRYIHRNAVSNACKYGKKGGVVLTELRYLSSAGTLEMNVINLPGEGHEQLLSLGDDGEKGVFEPGRRLHGLDDLDLVQHDAKHSHSSGDGAWISSKCANTFGGTCSIRFETERTVFTMRCPAKTFSSLKRLSSMCRLKDPSKFILPDKTWGIAIDDSKIQRKLMHRLFSLAGIPEDRQVVLGKDVDEIRGFNDVVTKTVAGNPESHILLIADENLDVMEDATHHQTVSGSMCVKKLREQLPAEDERRILALVRSANDSGSDIALYKSRAHGFFPKAPIKRDKVIEMLEPLWSERFPETLGGEIGDGEEYLDEDGMDVFVSSAADLVQTLDVIDALLMQNQAALATRWPVVWDKLHSLMGDLKTIQQNQLTVDVLGTIESFRGRLPPDDFIGRWKVVRSVIMSIIRC